MPDSIYELTGPTSFSGPPTTFSYSSLGAIERCPLQWQLARSQYGDREGFPSRPSRAAVEGAIVHETLDYLFKRLSFFGLPVTGTAQFRSAVSEANVHGFVAELVEEHESRLRDHPRGAGARIKSAQEQLVNRVIRLFREVYPKAAASRPAFVTPVPITCSRGSLPFGEALVDLVKHRGALGELALKHPQLPFRGVLDLVWWDVGGPVVADFKTGSPRPEHENQVGYYAVLWWRCSGLAPVRCEVLYPGSVLSRKLTEPMLKNLEDELSDRIEVASGLLTETPAPANLGDFCGSCEVRQFCKAFWESLAQRRGFENPADLELVVGGEPTSTGFMGTTQRGDQISVVFEADIGRGQNPFRVGEKIRILNGQTVKSGKSLELRSWSEVFRLGE